MGSAKDIIVKTIKKTDADKIVKKYHYSGKVVQNSNLNFGVFYKGLLLGAMQFGSPTDKRKILPLVKGTKWNEMLELNRMAFSDALPRFSESRALSIALKWIKKNAPQIKWIISFADGTQCGHGTIYQASNFKLIQIKKNNRMVLLPNGEVTHFLNFSPSLNTKYTKIMKKMGITKEREFLDKYYKGWRFLEGYMFKYIYFIDKEAEKNFTGEFIPFSRIKELGIRMYKGVWIDKEQYNKIMKDTNSGASG
jgi:hypothetical protein